MVLSRGVIDSYPLNTMETGDTVSTGLLMSHLAQERIFRHTHLDTSGQQIFELHEEVFRHLGTPLDTPGKSRHLWTLINTPGNSIQL